LLHYICETTSFTIWDRTPPLAPSTKTKIADYGRGKIDLPYPNASSNLKIDKLKSLNDSGDNLAKHLACIEKYLQQSNGPLQGRETWTRVVNLINKRLKVE
jgi:hypothetical protein